MDNKIKKDSTGLKNGLKLTKRTFTEMYFKS